MVELCNRGVLLVLAGYRRLLSPFLPCSCRFHPSCSAYAGEAIERFGIYKGARLALGRVLRCHPLTDGGYDPVRRL